MKKIYADTSVIGGCFDVEFREDSLELFEAFKTGFFKMILSDLTQVELSRVRRAIKVKVREIPTNCVIDAQCTPEAFRLAEEYIRSGALTNKCYHDAMHIAIATIYEADVLASWNFKHTVNIEKIPVYNSVNESMGYKTINILTPDLILNAINYEKGEKL
jgi:predicted nucleic acid-binding protein